MASPSDSAIRRAADFSIGIRIALEFGRKIPLMGEAARFAGRITEEQLQDCLEIQRRERANAPEKARRLGDILVDQRCMSRVDVESLVETLVQIRLAMDGLKG